MVPGQGHITFPAGTAKLLPKDAVLVFQIRYTTNGTAPTGASALFGAQIAVNTTTTIRALAIDPAGNANAGGAVAFTYTLQARATPTPASIDFGSQTVGTTSATIVVTMKNTGAADMTISGVSLGGVDATQFQRGVNLCNAAVLSPQETCTVEVRFAPTTAGLNKSAALSFAFAAPAPQGATSVALSGDGVAATDGSAPTVPGTPTVSALSTSSLRVTWAASSDNVGVTAYEVYRDGATTATATVTTNAFTDTGLAAGSTHSYRVRARDAAGNWSGLSLAGSGRTTSADATAPTITGRSPGINATNASRTGNITATFSENVTGVNATTFTLKNAATGVAVGATSVSYNTTTRVATFDPNVTLAADTKYTATLTTAIKDPAGNALAGSTTQPRIWTFTTGPRPTVTSRSPAHLATGVGRTANVTATFSEAVRNVTTTTFTLRSVSSTGTLGTAVTAVVSRNGTTNQWILNPGVTLAAGTKYRATLTGGVTDLIGNPLAQLSWDFTTGSA